MWIKWKNFYPISLNFNSFLNKWTNLHAKLKINLTISFVKLKGIADIPENTLKYLSAFGSSPGILYGLPKIHKDDFKDKFQFRPIFAAYNNPCFKLAKFIVSVITPFINNEFTVLNSTAFASELQHLDSPNENLFMTSYVIWHWKFIL